MPGLCEYIDRAETQGQKELLQAQWAEACASGSVHCGCGQLRALSHAYRCLYCGVWFCFTCAEEHFGLTVREWIGKKRADARASLDVDSQT